MESPKLLGIILTIVLLLVSVGSATVNSQTYQSYYKDFGVTNQTNSDGTTVYSYDVILKVVSETNGEWISGKVYAANWVINLTYVNQDIFSGDSLSVVFSLPSNISTSSDVSTKVTANQVILMTPLSYGLLMMDFTAGNTPMKYQFNSSILITTYNNNEVVAGLGNSEWVQSTILPINIVNNVVPEFPSLSILIVLMFVISLNVFVLTKRKHTVKK
jgi:hypothetical protein